MGNNFIKINHNAGFQWNLMIYVASLIGIIYPFWSILNKQSNIILIITTPIISGIATGIILIALCSSFYSTDIDYNSAQKTFITSPYQHIVCAMLFNIFIMMAFITKQRIIYYTGSFIIFFSIVINRNESILHWIINIGIFLLTLAPTQSLLFPIKKYNDKNYDKLDYVIDALTFLTDIISNKKTAAFISNWRNELVQ